jgi:hypothetical protein
MEHDSRRLVDRGRAYEAGALGEHGAAPPIFPNESGLHGAHDVRYEEVSHVSEKTRLRQPCATVSSRGQRSFDAALRRAVHAGAHKFFGPAAIVGGLRVNRRRIGMERPQASTRRFRGAQV